MANAGEIRVELKLITDKVRNQAREAMSKAKTEVESAFKSAGPTVRIPGSAQAGRDERGRFRPIVPQGPIGIGPSRFGGGSGLATPPPYMGATPPIITPAGSLAGMFNKVVTTQLSRPLQIFTQITAGLAAFRVVVGLASYAFRMLLAPVRMLASVFTQAATAARQLYANALSSGGMPMGFVSQRANLAQIIGVSERDVMQFGAAVAFLDSKIKDSSATLARNAPYLAAADYNMSALGLQIKAVFSDMATAAAPFIGATANILRTFIEQAKAAGDYQIILAGVANMAQSVSSAMLLVVGTMKMFALGIQALIDTFQWALKHLKLMTGLGPAGPAMVKDPFKETKEVWGELKDLFKASKLETVAAPAASSSRLPVSAWERMGLVIGQGAGTNWSEQTAKNTRSALTHLQTIANALMPRQQGRTDINPIFAQP